MKYETTKKAVTAGYCKVISIGYCDLQCLLRYVDPIAYTHGVYGWNANIYDFGSVAICTGYRPFGNVKNNYNLTREYNKKAKEIVENWDISYETKKEKVNKLLHEFIEVMTK